MFLFELLFCALLGLIFCFLGWRIWKKEQINLIHDYHYTKVTEKDKKQYTEKMGKACLVIGIGMILTGIVDFITHTSYGWIFFGVFFIIGLVIMICAQKKYNGGLF